MIRLYRKKIGLIAIIVIVFTLLLICFLFVDFKEMFKDNVHQRESIFTILDNEGRELSGADINLKENNKFLLSFEQSTDSWVNNIIENNDTLALICIVDGMTQNIELNGQKDKLHFIKKNEFYNLSFSENNLTDGFHSGLFVIVREPNQINLADDIRHAGVTLSRFTLYTGGQEKFDELQISDNNDGIFEKDKDWPIIFAISNQANIDEDNSLEIPLFISPDETNTINLNLLYKNRDKKNDFILIALKNWRQTQINGNDYIHFKLEEDECIRLPLSISLNNVNKNEPIIFILIPNPTTLVDRLKREGDLADYVSERMIITK